MRLINLTPHAVTILVDGRDPIVIPASGTIARCAVTRVVIGDVDGIPLTKSVFGDVTDLPDPAPDTLYIVSMLVASACSDRADLVIPDDTVRDDKGVIIGCKALGRV